MTSIKKSSDDTKVLWIEELPSTLWDIRTTVHSGARDTSFNLAYGSDAIITIEVEINSLQVAHFDSQKNETSIRANLDLLNDVKEDASLRAIVRQRQVA